MLAHFSLGSLQLVLQHWRYSVATPHFLRAVLRLAGPKVAPGSVANVFGAKTDACYFGWYWNVEYPTIMNDHNREKA